MDFKNRKFAMDWEPIKDYLWTPLVFVAAYFWKMIHRHDKEIAEYAKADDARQSAIAEAKQERKEIHDKIDHVRRELSSQHHTLRKEQREDFQEIRKAIASLGK